MGDGGLQALGVQDGDGSPERSSCHFYVYSQLLNVAESEFVLWLYLGACLRLYTCSAVES